MSKLSLKILACEIAQREIQHLAASSPHLLDCEFLPVGHHDEPQTGHRDLQARIDATSSEKFDAILVGYGICSQILSGLTARQIPLVIPRAHDCITFFLGSKQRYQQLFESCPGTYYFTAGWLEFPQRKALRLAGLRQFRAVTEDIATQLSPYSLGRSFEELVAKYGPDNAQYLLEVTQRWADSYQCATLISFDCTKCLNLHDKISSLCAKHGWQFKEIPGDPNLLRRWLLAQWDDDTFCTVPPGHAVFPSYNDQLLLTRPVPAPQTAPSQQSLYVR